MYHMDKEETSVTFSIEEMLSYMRGLYQTARPDLAVCHADNHRIFIDGNGTIVTVSMTDNSGHEYLLGYCASPFESFYSEEDRLHMEELRNTKNHLKDFFSRRHLGNRYAI